MYVDEVDVDEEGIAEMLMDDNAIAQVTRTYIVDGASPSVFLLSVILGGNRKLLLFFFWGGEGNGIVVALVYGFNSIQFQLYSFIIPCHSRSYAM